jgi:hypothetical protein
MNRRHFIKVGTITLGISALPIWNFLKKKTELEDLYDYLESHTIFHSTRGNISFKLHPHQKEILKNIHENDRVVITKARQIGMTTLLAGYLSWRNDPYRYYSANQGMTEYFKKTFDRFVKRSDNGKFGKSCYILDEVNFDRIPLPHLTNKTIIVGTPDHKGNLKFVVDRKDFFGLKVFTYSAYDCYPMWNDDSIDIHRQFSNHFNDEESFVREIEAKFV